ncbi:MAG: metallopeptidase TldD-related protein [Leptospirillia bacterium]
MSLDRVREALDDSPQVAAWSVVQQHGKSHQRYRTFRRVDAERTAEFRTVNCTVFTEGTKDGKAVMGEASFTLTGDTLASPHASIKRAAKRATLVANPPYTLPGPAVSPELRLADPQATEDPWGLISDVEAEIDAAAGADTPLCHAEIFCDRKAVTVMNSEGFTGRYNATELFLEFVLLAENGMNSVEVQGIRRARRLLELAAGEAVAHHARWAADRLKAVLPPTGVMPVVFGGDSLDSLFDTFAAHTGAKACYEGWSRLDKGGPIIKDCIGEPVSIMLDPHLPWRLTSRPFDSEGLVTRPVRLVTEGRVSERSAAKRHADYLGLTATGTHGSLVVGAGTTSMDTMFDDGPVLHALRFSTFHPNPVTGAFSGELRTAYLHQPDGSITPISGGSVSGNVWSAFANARLSDRTCVRATYEGPCAVRLEGITVAGKG